MSKKLGVVEHMPSQSWGARARQISGAHWPASLTYLVSEVEGREMAQQLTVLAALNLVPSSCAMWLTTASNSSYRGSNILASVEHSYVIYIHNMPQNFRSHLVRVIFW